MPRTTNNSTSSAANTSNQINKNTNNSFSNLNSSFFPSLSGSPAMDQSQSHPNSTQTPPYQSLFWCPQLPFKNISNFVSTKHVYNIDSIWIWCSCIYNYCCCFLTYLHPFQYCHHQHQLLQHFYQLLQIWVLSLIQWPQEPKQVFSSLKFTPLSILSLLPFRLRDW